MVLSPNTRLLRHPRRYRSLRSRLTLTSLAVSLSLVILSLGANWILLRHETHHRAEESLDSIASLLVYGVAAGLDFDSRESVRQALAGVFRIEEIRFAGVTKPDGTLYESLGDWPSWGLKGFHGLHQSEIERHDAMLIAHEPIRDSASQYIGTLHVGYALENVQAGLRRALLLLMIAGILLVLLGAAATRRVGRRLTAPILELAAAVRNLAEGRFEKPLEIRDHDEVGTVAAAFNEMAARLETSRQEVERQNRELEMNVRERTTELRQKNLALAIQNEKVMEVSRLKSAFLANMSHELRTPLNAILALSEMLRDGVTGPLPSEEQVRQASMIYQSGENLLRLINDVLDLSKVEAGKMEIRYERVDLQETLKSSLEPMISLARTKGLAFRSSFAGQGQVWADPNRIRQVFMNLIGNAIKFTEGGFVQVESHLDLDGEMIEVKVADTGIGIAPEDQDRVFQEFRQVDGSVSRRFGGTGLGLAICRRLVELMGGEIQMTSVLGEGSTFHFRIPVYQSEPEAVAGPPETRDHEDPLAERTVPDMEQTRRNFLHPTPVPSPGGGGRGCVLVVDDDETVLEVLLRYLARRGFEVHIAHDGAEALRELRAHRPDVMVLDLMMPGMNGFEVIDRLRQDPTNPMVPVLVYTAKDLSPKEWSDLQGSVSRILHKGDAGAHLLLDGIQTLLDGREPGLHPGESDRAAA